MKKQLKIDDDYNKQVYIENRNSLFDELKDCLADKKNPFAKIRANNIIKEQEEFLKYIQQKGHKYAIYKEEKAFLNKLIKYFEEIK